MTDPAAQARAALAISTLLSLNQTAPWEEKKALKWENKTLTVNRLLEVTTEISLEGTVNGTSGQSWNTRQLHGFQ